MCLLDDKKSVPILLNTTTHRPTTTKRKCVLFQPKKTKKKRPTCKTLNETGGKTLYSTGWCVQKKKISLSSLRPFKDKKSPLALRRRRRRRRTFSRDIYIHTHTLLLLLNGGLVGTRFLCVRRLSFFRARGGGERGEKNGLGDDDDFDDDSRAPPPIFVVEVVP